ncbi:MAG: WG repeat-containing protein, partial [Fulvivirga sp.]|uniref:WG repeat-containing protein n=1 Tax=Fulvivirga sp. TaxID=1931237 RepID=UPI0032ECC331
MHRLSVYFFIATAAYLSSCSDYFYVKSSLKSQQNGKVEKAEMYVQKAMEKDSLQPAVFYASASLFFDSAYNNFNIDKAYYQLNQSRMFFASLEEKEMKKHVNAGIDLLAINRLKKRIEYAAFIRAELTSTEASYNSFLAEFGATNFDELAALRRDSLAFITASSLNTYQAYEEFMNKYPDAIQILEAKKKYEKLYFLKSTSDGRLASYINFLKVHPDTPYRNEAEREIFEISTAGNSESGYQKFINAYPKSIYTNKAKRLLFHLAPAGFKWKSDSLNKAFNLMNRGELIPINKSKKYGFTDLKGEEVVPPKYDNLKESYLCQTLKTDFFETDREIIALDQSVIFSGLFTGVQDLGLGTLKIETPAGVFIMHKSGWPIISQKLDDAKRINSFLAIAINGKWGVISLNGRQIVEPEFDDIWVAGNFYFFKKGEQFDVVSHNQLANSADNQTLKIQPLYDDYDLIDENKLWVKSEYGQAVFNQYLSELIPYGNHQIDFLTSGYLIKKQNNVRWLNTDFKLAHDLMSVSVKTNDSYIVVNDESSTALYTLDKYKKIKDYDSAALIGRNFALGYANDSVFVYFKNKHMLANTNIKSVEFITSSNSYSYVSIPSKRRGKTYYNEMGEIVLEGNFDSVTPLGQEYLVVTDRGKKGLYSTKYGQILA